MDDNRNFVLNTYRSVSKENVERLLQREVEQFLTDLILMKLMSVARSRTSTILD